MAKYTEHVLPVSLETVKTIEEWARFYGFKLLKASPKGRLYRGTRADLGDAVLEMQVIEGKQLRLRASCETRRTAMVVNALFKAFDLKLIPTPPAPGLTDWSVLVYLAVSGFLAFVFYSLCFHGVDLPFSREHTIFFQTHFMKQVYAFLAFAFLAMGFAVHYCVIQHGSSWPIKMVSMVFAICFSLYSTAHLGHFRQMVVLNQVSYYCVDSVSPEECERAKAEFVRITKKSPVTKPLARKLAQLSLERPHDPVVTVWGDLVQHASVGQELLH